MVAALPSPQLYWTVCILPGIETRMLLAMVLLVTGCAGPRPLMGGNFYGGHIAFAMDAVKAAVASVADLCDRQGALLVDPRFNRGLPGQLAMPTEDGEAPRHAFKGMQITLSALTAEALQASMPVASFSRSTESHNQDKVSMGTIAARETLRVCELVGHALAVHLLVAAQACELRGGVAGRPEVAAQVSAIRKLSAQVGVDLPVSIATMGEQLVPDYRVRAAITWRF